MEEKGHLQGPNMCPRVPREVVQKPSEMQSTAPTSKACTPHRCKKHRCAQHGWEGEGCEGLKSPVGPERGPGAVESGQHREQGGHGAAAPSQAHGVAVGPAARRRPSHPRRRALCVQRSVSGAALSLRLGPRDRNKGAILISSFAGERRDRPREKSSVCKTQQSAGNFPPALTGCFFSSLFLFFINREETQRYGWSINSSSGARRLQ